MRDLAPGGRCSALALLPRGYGRGSGASAYDPRLRSSLGGYIHSLPSFSPASLTAPQGEPEVGRRAAGSGQPVAALASAPKPERAAGSHSNGRVTAARPAPCPA